VPRPPQEVALTREARQYARGIVEGATLDAKLVAPSGVVDGEPGPALRLERPGRPPELRWSQHGRVKVPNVEGMADPAQRVRILHALANHELQAVELFAWALLAFPEAPAAFRRGLLRRIAEEQRHVRMYVQRLDALGTRLGDFPVSGYFWSKTPGLTTPLRFVCAMGLTFENANLDHTALYEAAALRAGDVTTARLLRRVGADEIAHVRFAWRWLLAWKRPDESPWEAYSANVIWPLRGALARGKSFHAEIRRAVGLDEEFIRKLAASDRGSPRTGTASR